MDALARTLTDRGLEVVAASRGKLSSPEFLVRFGGEEFALEAAETRPKATRADRRGKASEGAVGVLQTAEVRLLPRQRAQGVAQVHALRLQGVLRLLRHVIGRKTYETALGFDSWPYAGKRCVVLTHDKTGRSKHGEEFSSETPKKLVARPTADRTKRIYLDGGAVIQSFLAAGMVTDLTISIVPVLLGEGIPLFRRHGPDVALELVGSRAFDSGLVQVAYRVGRTAR